MKPSNLSRGREIHCINNLSKITKNLNETNNNIVLQKYIENPLIIHKKKFDIRQWVLITSIHPLTIWKWEEPYLRFSAENYDIENINNIYVINNIKSSFGRYVISYLNQYNCIFVTGRQGIYLISCEKYELITFFKVDEWISSISYDYYNDYLICGTWKKNTVNDQKIYNLIIYEIVDDNLENKPLDNMNIREVDRKNNIHFHDIVVIKPTKEGFILTGSNDRTIKVWKYI
jgi:hypothetical protein